MLTLVPLLETRGKEGCYQGRKPHSVQQRVSINPLALWRDIGLQLIGGNSQGINYNEEHCQHFLFWKSSRGQTQFFRRPEKLQKLLYCTAD